MISMHLSGRIILTALFAACVAGAATAKTSTIDAEHGHLRRMGADVDVEELESPLPCNGSPGICNLPVSSVVFPAVHNAMSSEVDGFTAFNNLRSMEDALASGIRAMQIDSCDCGDLGLQFCHGECFYFGFLAIGHRDPENMLKNIKAFLDENPRELIIIDLQVNDDTLDAVYAVLQSIPGFVDMMYDHPRLRDDWPLMGDLIDANKRIIFFQHNGPSCRNDGCPPGIHSTFDHMWDTPFDLDEEGLLDYESSCVKNRGQLNSAFMMSNHFATNGGLASSQIAQDVNELSILKSRNDYCQAKLGKLLNIVMVDFWSVGNVVEFARQENARRTGEVLEVEEEAVVDENTTESIVTDSSASVEASPEEELFCLQDVFDCGNDVFVSRDPMNECNFFPCPDTKGVSEVSEVAEVSPSTNGPPAQASPEVSATSSQAAASENTGTQQGKSSPTVPVQYTSAAKSGGYLGLKLSSVAVSIIVAAALALFGM